MLKLILVDPNVGVCQAWEKYFGDLPNIQIVNDYFENLPEFDCMVSAANSFGLMDGGVDAAITRFFRTQLVRCVQERILTDFRGEQPVGTSIIVETSHSQHPFLAHTPTMRVPMTIAHTDNVYLAMWAMLLTVQHHNDTNEQNIGTVACPGLGTATGHVPFREAERQMSLAHRNFLHPPQHIDWSFATERQVSVRFGCDEGSKFPTD